MPDYRSDMQYMKIIGHILENEEFKSLENLQHHNQTRLDHCIKVSYNSYKLAKKLKLDYEDVARAALLHDFYLEQVNEQEKIKDKILLFTTKHPEQALINSLKYFDLSDKEQDIIRSHMFPVDIKIPKYLESWLVSAVDKVVSVKEFKFKFQSRLSWVNVYILLLFRFIR